MYLHITSLLLHSRSICHLSDMMQGFGRKEHNPMYKTSASDYGSGLPNYHTMPTEFYYKSQKFSEVSSFIPKLKKLVHQFKEYLEAMCL